MKKSGCWNLATLTIALVAMVTAARADIIQISGTALVLRAPDLTTDKIGSDDNLGVLQDAKGSYYAAVPFPADGNKVCKFTFVYRDNDNNGQTTAWLKKKKINIGGDFFAPPVVMTKLSSGKATASDTVVSKHTNHIVQATLDLANAFYYVQIDISTPAEILGVLIEHKPSC